MLFATEPVLPSVANVWRLNDHERLHKLAFLVILTAIEAVWFSKQ